MSGSFKRGGRIGLALALVALLSACISPGPNTRLYTLTAANPPLASASASAPPTTNPRTLLIQDIQLPAYLDRPEIVTRDTVNRLEWSETAQWGGVLSEDMARVLAMNLGQMLDGYRILTTPPAYATPPDYRLELVIRSFERLASGQIELVAEWSLLRNPDRQPLASAPVLLLSTTLPAGADYDQLVLAMSAVYADLARHIAQGMPPAAREK
jgi:uncharacterized protein